MQTHRFLTRTAIVDEIQALVAGANHRLCLAVAFWGNDSVERLGLKHRGRAPIQILCNAHSGVCNPDALTEMLALPNIEIRSNRRLHAKLYWSESRMIVGSANASANGLCYESAGEVDGWHEAAILSLDSGELESAIGWFDTLFGRDDSEIIDRAFISQIRPIWDASRKRRAAVIDPHSRDIVDVLDHHPEVLKDRKIMVSIYRTSDRTKQAEDITKKLKKAFDQATEASRHEPIAGLNFRMIDTYETTHVAVSKKDELLDSWPWESWLIDVSDETCVFWYVPRREAAEKFTDKDGRIGFVVPVYGSDRLPLGDGVSFLTIKRPSHAEIRKRIIKEKGRRQYLDIDIWKLRRPTDNKKHHRTDKNR